MSNWQQQPQQWNSAPQGGFTGQPQQSQGWGQGVGQWQQAPPPGQAYFNAQQKFPVHGGQQQGQAFPQNQGVGVGFMTGPAGGHLGGFQPGGGGIPPGRIGGVGQPQFTGFPQQQQQLQAMQQQQQQQQMAYRQEQQRLAREEQKKRELEIQKRKLMNINVANPTSSSLSFDDLVSLPSSSPRSSPKVNRQGQSTPKTAPAPASATSTTQQQPATSTIDDPLPTQSNAAIPSQLVETTPITMSSDRSNPAPPAGQSENTFEKLMESSLGNLRDTSPARSRKMDFKSSASGSKPSPLTSAQQQKSFSQSTRARAWTADGGGFSGIFSQCIPPQEQQPSQMTTNLQGDDSFGEFQSVGVGDGTGSDNLSTQANNISLQKGLQPIQQAQQVFQRQSLVGDAPQQQTTRMRGGSLHGGNTVPTSSYRHPIPSTSVSQKPLSPTHFSSLDPNKFPRLYTKVFERCSKPGEPYMDTKLLFPLLVSSQLPKNVLRDLWSLANREVPGKLNQTELYVLLGLIALVQSGTPSPTPEDLKKAPQLPIPKLSTLEEEIHPTASIPLQKLSSSQGPTPPSAPPPAEDFGDFQQGHQQSSFQSSFPVPVPVAPPSGPSLVPSTVATTTSFSLNVAATQHTAGGGADKYSIFDDELKSSGSGLLSQNLPPSDSTGLIAVSSSTAGPQGKPISGDKYSVFDDLRSTSSDDAISVASSDIMTSSALVGSMAPPQGLLPLATANAALISGVHDEFGSFSSVPLSSSSNSMAAASEQSQDGLLPFSSAPSATVSGSDGGFADFASFQSQGAPFGGGEGLKPAATEAHSSVQGWASFAGLRSSSSSSSQSQGGIFSDQDMNFPSSLLQTATAPSKCNSTTTTTTAAKFKTESAFDSLLPAELLKSSASVESHSLLGSLDSKPAAVTSSTGSVAMTVGGGGGVGLDFAMFETEQPSPESKKKEKELKKQLTGLEVLEEEFSARVSAKSASSSSAAPVVSILEPLVPESAPLDEFGEFEAYSSPGKEEKKSGLLLAGGESPPVLKKSSTDPLKVWSTCLTKCSDVLESCMNVFSDVKEESVLEEIAQSEEGRNKLKGIVEVYRLAKRVYRPFREKKEDAEGESCVRAIQKQWKKMVNVLPHDVMTQLYIEITPASVEEEDVLSDSISKCSLCLTSKNVSIPPHLALDLKREDYTMPLLFHSGQSYHPSCANFWINVIQEKLPVLT